MITALAFLSGFLLSIAAAYYSIIGLIAIFPGATFAVAAMGSTLEFAKLVAVSWLYRNWDIAPRFLKSYLMIAILLLMFITSMGVFGFLSRAHLEHSLTSGADVDYQIQTLTQKIEAKQRLIASIDKQILALDETYARYVELGSLTKGLEQKGNIDKQRNELEDRRQSVETEVLALRENVNKLNVTVKKQEVEVGPLKYIAELIYEDGAQDHFDKAVRFVIILLIVVFDPLAVMLLIAGNVSLADKPKEIVVIAPKRKYNRKKPEPEAFDIGKEMKQETEFGVKKFWHQIVKEGDRNE
jgi:hypothetical protein